MAIDVEPLRHPAARSPASMSPAGVDNSKRALRRRPHQKAAIADVLQGFEQHDRGVLVMASGAGKTFTCMWVAEDLAAESVLVLVPSIALLRQTLLEWCEHARFPIQRHGVLAVCSDGSVADDDVQLGDEGIELPGVGRVGVTTEADDIRSFLGGRGRRVLFCTYQSSPRVAEAMRTPSVPDFDLAIADEAHRTASSSGRGSAMATITGEGIRAAKRLFATATPRTYSTAPKANDLVVASMDDERLYGPVFHRYSFAEAIADGVLSDYRAVVVTVTEKEAEELIRRGGTVAVGELRLEAQELAQDVALLYAVREYGIRSVITFHRLTKRARLVAERLPRVAEWLPAEKRPPGRITTDHVNGAMPAAERDERLRKLGEASDDESVIVTNCRCLTEGVDVPALDAVAIIDPRHSEIDITQAVGRVLRKHPGKELGYVLVAVVVPEERIQDGMSPEDLAVAPEWKPVLRVVNALRAHDERLGQALDHVRRTKASGAPEEVAEKFVTSHLDIVGPTDHLGRTGRDGSFANAVRLAAVVGTTTSWWERYGELEQWVRRTGQFPIMRSKVPREAQLAQWCAHQRRDHSAGRMGPGQERFFLLTAIPGWFWDGNEETERRWHETRAKVDAFVRKYGRLPSQAAEALDVRRLGNWASAQRACYQQGVLSVKQVVLLEAIPGWFWDGNEETERRWHETRAKVDAFVRKYGRLPSITAEDAEEGGLGSWCARRRRDHKRGKLTSDQIILLQKIPGWRWGYDDTWRETYSHVVAFVRAQFRLPAVNGGEPEERQLGSWCANQRRAAKAGALSSDRRDLLAAIPGWHWGYDDKWRLAYHAVVAFVEQHNRLPSQKAENAEEGRLGRWCSKQRMDCKGGKLSEDKGALLAKISGWYW